MFCEHTAKVCTEGVAIERTENWGHRSSPVFYLFIHTHTHKMFIYVILSDIYNIKQKRDDFHRSIIHILNYNTQR